MRDSRWARTVVHPVAAAVSSATTNTSRSIENRGETNELSLARKRTDHSSREGDRMRRRFLPAAVKLHDWSGPGAFQERKLIDALSIVTEFGKIHRSCAIAKVSLNLLTTKDRTMTSLSTESTNNASEMERIKALPKEVGVLLVVAGVGGMLLPGPVGTPILILGGVVLWPSAFQKLENWFERRFPKAHRQGMREIKRFLDDMERRYPQPK